MSSSRAQTEIPAGRGARALRFTRSAPAPQAPPAPAFANRCGALLLPERHASGRLPRVLLPSARHARRSGSKVAAMTPTTSFAPSKRATAPEAQRQLLSPALRSAGGTFSPTLRTADLIEEDRTPDGPMPPAAGTKAPAPAHTAAATDRVGGQPRLERWWIHNVPREATSPAVVTPEKPQRAKDQHYSRQRTGIPAWSARGGRRRLVPGLQGLKQNHGRPQHLQHCCPFFCTEQRHPGQAWVPICATYGKKKPPASIGCMNRREQAHLNLSNLDVIEAGSGARPPRAMQFRPACGDRPRRPQGASTDGGSIQTE